MHDLFFALFFVILLVLSCWLGGHYLDHDKPAYPVVPAEQHLVPRN